MVEYHDEPPLPLELEYYIFELAATNPENPYRPYTHLLLVCKLIYNKLKPLIYRTVLLNDYSELTTFPLDACQYIHNLSINETRWPLAGFLKQCSNLKNLRNYDLDAEDLSDDSPDAHNALPQTTSLYRLYTPCVWNSPSPRMSVLSDRRFASLTHLDSTFRISSAQLLNMFIVAIKAAGLPELTHLQIQDIAREDAHILDEILGLQGCALRVVVLHHFEWHSPDDEYVLNHRTPTQKSDARLVMFKNRSLSTDEEDVDEWLAGIYRHRLDMWGIAEGVQWAHRCSYFKNDDEARMGICPTAQGMREALDDKGITKLMESSELWADYLRV